MTTAEWLAGTVRAARPDSSENPMPQPAATTASDAHSRPAGRRCLVTRSTMMEMSAGTTARP